MNKKILKLSIPLILLIIITAGAFYFNNKNYLGGRTFAGRLQDLSDVLAPTPSSGDILQYNGTNWINAVSGSSAWTATSGSDIYFSSGNVGIGTNNPQYTLDINGSIKANGAVYLPISAGSEENNIPTSIGGGAISVAQDSVYFPIGTFNDGLQEFTLAASSSMLLNDGVTNYIVADYNGGSPKWSVLTDESLIDYVNYLPFAECYRSGSNVHIQLSPIQSRNEITKDHERMAKTSRYALEPGGLNAISVDSSLNIVVAGGNAWAVNTKYSIPTSGTSTRQFNSYHTSTSTWQTDSHLIPVLDNLNYDNGSSLASITPTYWGIVEVWRGIESQDHIYTIYGDAEYQTATLAEAAGRINSVPEILSSHAAFIGRVIFEAASTTGFIVQNVSDTTFGGSNSITAHNSLGGLQGGISGEYYHLTATQNTNVGNLSSMAYLPNIGSTTITTLGTITTGIWSGTSIANAKIASSTEYLSDILWNGSTVTNGTITNLTVTTATSGIIIATSELKLPNSATLATNNAGDIGIDTTTGQLRYNDGTATRTLTYFTTPTVTLASTTLTGGAATTTILLGYATAAETWSSVICGTDTGTSTLRFGDGTNYTDTVTATSTPYPTTLSSNNAFTANEKRQIQIMTTTGSPNYISCTIKKTWDND